MEQTATYRILDKWGQAADAGFMAIPDILFKSQGKIGLSNTELVVLLNIIMHWWYPHQNPFPRSTTIAKRMNIETRTVQRCLVRLEELSLIKRIKTKTKVGSNYQTCDLTGLVTTLNELIKGDAAYDLRLRARKDLLNERAQ